MTKTIILGTIIAAIIISAGITMAYAGNEIKLAGTVNLDGNQAKNLAEPTDDADAATKNYVDSQDQYVVFQTPSTIHFLASETCDVAGGSAQQHHLRIDGSSDFMVTGITFQSTGVDQASDQISFGSIFVDGVAVNFSTGDLTGTSTFSRGWDIAGIPNFYGGNYPTSITATGAGSDDIVLVINCFADTTTDITFPAGSIVVSGWKLASDTITATYD